MRRHFMGFACLILAAAAGCGGGGGKPAPERIPVTGTVMYKGSPVEGANVQFHNDAAPGVASGMTDAEGKFSLTMLSPNDGAVAGTNFVTVTKGDAPAAGAASNAPPTPEDLAKSMAEMKSKMDKKEKAKAGAIPSKYGMRGTTPLKVEVSAQSTVFPIQLAD